MTDTTETIAGFLDSLAAKVPAPGGGASAGLHLWVAALPLGLRGGVTMASFFLVQALALALERRLGIARRPPLLRRAWTITIVVASSPLFVEPMLQILAPLAAWFA